jgi:hypothetical protein
MPQKSSMTQRSGHRNALASGLLIALALALGGAPGGVARADGVVDLARCIRESGAVFYGAHWCPYCRKQKQRFGNAAHLLPYVECYDPGTRNQRAVCAEQNVRSYPTWVFWDGTVRSGNLSLGALAHHTDCEAPD